MDRGEIRQQLERLHADSFGWALACCGGNREDAEDVLQTAYLKVLTGKARFGGRSTLRTWFFSVIRLTAADDRRRWATRRAGQERWEQETRPVTAQAAAAEGQVDRRRLAVRFRAALAELPGRQREVLWLVFYDDHSVSEAAEVMGVSVGSARTHYHRGKQRLREWMLEHDDEA